MILSHTLLFQMITYQKKLNILLFVLNIYQSRMPRTEAIVSRPRTVWNEVINIQIDYCLKKLVLTI